MDKSGLKCPCCGKEIPIIGADSPPQRRVKISVCNADWDAGSPPAAVMSHGIMGNVGKLDSQHWVFEKKKTEDKKEK